MGTTDTTGKVEAVSEELPKFLVTEGTKALDAQMKPADVASMDYMIPQALGHSEHEDIAARILRMSREQGQFVAPSYRALADQVMGELKTMEQIDKARSAISEASAPKRPQEGAGAVGRSVLGRIRGLFKREKATATVVEPAQPEAPVAPVMSQGELDELVNSLPHSVITFGARMGNFQILATEIRDMMSKGYLNLVSTEGGEDYIEPTAKLMERIMSQQRAARGGGEVVGV